MFFVEIGAVYAGLHIVGAGGVGFANITTSLGGQSSYSFGVRPVISLKSNVNVTSSFIRIKNETYNIVKKYG